MRKLLLGLSVVTMAVPASAAEWRILNWNDNFVLYMDQASISQGRDTVSYTARVVFLRDAAVAQVDSRVEMRCAQRVYRNISVSAIGRDGAPQAAEPSRAWRQIEAGTNIEREAMKVCPPAQ